MSRSYSLWALMGLVTAASPSTLVAQPQRSGPVLASELYFEEARGGGGVSWTADPHLSRYPAIFRALRAEAQREILAPLGDGCEVRCWRTGNLEQSFAGSRLLSMFSSVETGVNADGGTELRGVFYDLQSGRRMRFADLFTSWSQAKPLIQAKFCAAFREWGRSHDFGEVECPDADASSVAFGLAHDGQTPGRADAYGIEFRVSRYAFSPGSVGWESSWFELDRPLYNLIKPEFRADFRTPSAS